MSRSEPANILTTSTGRHLSARSLADILEKARRDEVLDAHICADVQLRIQAVKDKQRPLVRDNAVNNNRRFPSQRIRQKLWAKLERLDAEKRSAERLFNNQFKILTETIAQRDKMERALKQVFDDKRASGQALTVEETSMESQFVGRIPEWTFGELGFEFRGSMDAVRFMRRHWDNGSLSTWD